MTNKIYILPTTTDNDILTQNNESLITENTYIEVPLLTQDLQGILTQYNENLIVKNNRGEPYFIVLADEQNLNKNYIPTINFMVLETQENLNKNYTPTINTKIYGN